MSLSTAKPTGTLLRGRQAQRRAPKTNGQQQTLQEKCLYGHKTVWGQNTLLSSLRKKENMESKIEKGSHTESKMKY